MPCIYPSIHPSVLVSFFITLIDFLIRFLINDSIQCAEIKFIKQQCLVLLWTHTCWIHNVLSITKWPNTWLRVYFIACDAVWWIGEICQFKDDIRTQTKVSIDPADPNCRSSSETLISDIRREKEHFAVFYNLLWQRFPLDFFYK